MALLLQMLVVAAVAVTTQGTTRLHRSNVLFRAGPMTHTELTLSHGCDAANNKCRLLVVLAGEAPNNMTSAAKVGDLTDVYADDRCNPADLYVVAVETTGPDKGAAWSACAIHPLNNDTQLAKGNCKPEQPRSLFSLNSGWRFQLADSPASNCTSGGDFPTDLSGKQCYGLSNQAEVPDAPTCQQTCCTATGCTVWQYNTSAAGLPSACWTGNADPSKCTPDAAWKGGGRPAPAPPPVPAPGGLCNSTREPRCSTGFDDSGWRAVTAPHDFVVEGNFTAAGDKSHGYLPFGVGWYRKTFDLVDPGAVSVANLRFEGTMGVTQVWLNGELLGVHASGYTPHEYFLGASNSNDSLLVWGGTNVLALRIDATSPDGWWYDGGGLYRDASLIVTGQAFIPSYGVYAPAVVTSAISGNLTASALVSISTQVNNTAAEPSTMRASARVISSDGAVVGEAPFTAATVPAGGSITVSQNVSIASASLWSVSSPTLYTVRVTLESPEAQLLDQVDTPIGVRQLRFDPEQGMIMNGVPTKLLGAANHQDFGGLGVAVPRELQRHRIQKLKDFGGNAWRTAHNPPDPALLDAADELGFLVWDENHRNGQDTEMETLILRDRNHPSVVIWSLCNEVLCNTNNTVADAARLKGIAKRLDPLMQRPVAANNNGLNGNDTVLDLQGFDYSTGSYDAWHARAPQIPAISSETSSAVSDRGEYDNNATTGHVSGYDDNAPSWGESAEVAWAAIMQRSFISGGFTWTGWDYKGEPTPYAYPDINSHFGILDIAGFEKDRAHWYRAWWIQDTPALHVLPHWNWTPETCVAPGCRIGPSSTMLIDVWVFSNAQEVELLLPNGTSLGNHPNANYSHAEWKDVPYSPRNLTAIARNAGKVVLTETISSTGPAAQLRASIKDGVGSRLAATERNVALIQVEILDASGSVVPEASNVVKFVVEGPGTLIGTANGDPASHTPDKASSREAFHGKVLGVLLPHTGDGGMIKIVVSSPGLVSSMVQIPVSLDCGELQL